MFVASWNAKREITNNATKYNKKLSLVSKGKTGHYVNGITISDPASSNMSSQSASRDANILYIPFDGRLYYGIYNDTTLGIRPVV